MLMHYTILTPEQEEMVCRSCCRKLPSVRVVKVKREDGSIGIEPRCAAHAENTCGLVA